MQSVPCVKVEHGLETRCCLVCSDKSPENLKKEDVSKFSSVDKFIHVLFVLKHLLKVRDECIEQLITCGASKQIVICNKCDESLEKIIEVHNQLLETSQDIYTVKKKLFPGKNRKRRLQIVCEEEEQSKEQAVNNVKKPQSLRGPDGQKDKSGKRKWRDYYEPVKKKAKQKISSSIGNLAMLICGEAPAKKDLLEDSEVDDHPAKTTIPTAEDDTDFVPVEDPLGDPSFSPDPELESSSESEPESRQPEPPKNKRPYFRVTPKPPPVKKIKPPPRPARPKSVSMECPFCKSFTGCSNEAIKFCEHLDECSKKVDGGRVPLTCKSCNQFTSSDIVLFSEHFSVCWQLTWRKEPVDGPIPINKRFIPCEACVPTKYFKLEGFLWHYVHHQKFQLKCSFVKEDGSPCGVRRDRQGVMKTHWMKIHRVPISKMTFDVDTALPVVQWFCHLCNSRFPNLTQRDLHLSFEHSEVVLPPPGTHKCVKCPFASFLQEDVRIHLTVEHPQLSTLANKPPISLSRSMKCPFCDHFRGSREKSLEFCQHLHTCSKARSDESLEGPSQITCTMCEKFTSSDLLQFSEHFADCRGSGETTGEALTPIRKRIIACDACENIRATRYFKFDDFLQHYIYHFRFNIKCTYLYDDGSHCGARFTIKPHMTTHWSKKHVKGTEVTPPEPSFVTDQTVPCIPWFCHLCNSRFTSVDDRNSHLDSEHSKLKLSPSETHKCDHCDFTSCIPEDIDTHRTLEHPRFVNIMKFGKSYQCEICKEYFPNLPTFERHQWTIHKAGRGTVRYGHPCPDCSEKFSDKAKLVSHQIRAHNRTDLGKDPLECELCGKFQARENLRKHMGAIHGVGAARKFICEICAVPCASKQSLQKHLHRMHKIGSFEPFKCPMKDCEQVFYDGARLKKHIAGKHSKTPLHNCEYCGKGFNYMDQLRKHLIGHKYPDWKPFSCALCPGKGYVTPQDLSLHWRTHGPEDGERLKKQGLKEEEKEEFLRVVGKDFKRVKMLYKTSFKDD